jgi:hypothetical protein
MSGQLFTVTAKAHGKVHKSSGLTHKQALRLVADLKEWGAEGAAMSPEPNLVWSALTVEQRRERAKFWQAVILAVAMGVFFAAMFWCSTIGLCRAWTACRIETTGEVLK